MPRTRFVVYSTGAGRKTAHPVAPQAREGVAPDRRGGQSQNLQVPSRSPAGGSGGCLARAARYDFSKRAVADDDGGLPSPRTDQLTPSGRRGNRRRCGRRARYEDRHAADLDTAESGRPGRERRRREGWRRVRPCLVDKPAPRQASVYD